MKLSELNPRWCLASRWDDTDGTQHFLNGETTKRSGMGLTFDCPVHRSHRLGVFFSNPIDGLPPSADVEHLWRREGETFAAMSLSPSINAAEYKGDDGTVCWHGFITNGEVR